MRRFLALGLVFFVLSSGLSGCSQPIDTGSSIPPQSQPFVALLALVGLGIGLTALHHHNEHHNGGGGAAIFPAAAVIVPSSLYPAGYTSTDISVDLTNFGVGVLGSSGTQTGKFVELTLTSGLPSLFGSYGLPTGYAPTAMTIDPQARDWFVDNSGKVVECDGPPTSTGTCTSSVTSFNDSLPVGQRSIGVDGNFLLIVEDAGSGSVAWYFQPLLVTAGPFSGSYQSLSTASIYPRDAVEITSTSTSVSDFTIYHQDGRSDSVTFPGGTSLSATASFTFSPVTLTAPSDNLFDTTNSLYTLFGFTGTPSGTYQITRYQNAAPTGLGGTLTTLSRTIALNGQFGGPSFAVPLTSLHFDNELALWGIDANGAVVEFASF